MTAWLSPSWRHPARSAALAGLMLASVGCDAFGLPRFEEVVPPKCKHQLEVEGQVGETTVGSDGYEHETDWFVYARDEWVIDMIGREGMKRLGLDSNSIEDVDRYHYWTSAFDLRVLEREKLGSGTLAPVGRDLGIYFYDLQRHDVQPGAEVEVFDVTSIEPLRDAGDLAALGDEVRRLVDEMRDNGQPDVVVAFSSDRSEETLPFMLFINLVAPATRFASSGVARYFDLTGTDGKYLRRVKYPPRDVNAVSVEAEVAFGEDELSVVDNCQSLSVVDIRD